MFGVILVKLGRKIIRTILCIPNINNIIKKTIIIGFKSEKPLIAFNFFLNIFPLVNFLGIYMPFERTYLFELSVRILSNK